MPSVGTDWEETFRLWAKPSSDTEQAKMDNAAAMVRAAVRDAAVLSRRTVEVFAQGSYRNNTNVRQDSDVDICVRCMDYSFDDFSQAGGVAPADAGRCASGYTYGQFRDEVGAALIAKFGDKGVTRGAKAFDVHPTSYRVDADVVAVLEHRRYFRDAAGNFDFHSGAEFHPDGGGRIVNWPHQHYASGVLKNKATGNRFKYITRVLKRLRYRMADKGVDAAKNLPSYFIECLTWNAPDECFNHDAYTDNVRAVLAHLFNGTRQDGLCGEWTEVNELKYLFNWAQPWTRQKGFDFVSAAWDYIGLE